MQRKKHTLILWILCSCTFFATAQYGGGSPYSAFGIGDLQTGGFGQTQGMAGSGIGLRSPAFLNLTNPASYTSIDFPINMMLDVGFDLQANHFATDSETAKQQNGGFSHLVTWFRPHRKWATSLGLVPYSKVGYSITTTRYLAGSDEPYVLNYEGEGGVNRLYWGNAVQLTPSWSLGANANLLFGSLDKTEHFISNSVLGSFDVVSQTHLRAFTFDVGTQWRIPIRKHTLTLGMTMSPGTAFYSDRSATLTTSTEGITDDDLETVDYELPLKAGAGFALASDRWTLTGDAVYEGWKGINLGTDAEPVDTWTGSLGFEYAPFLQKKQDYFKTLLLRAGFRYRNAYLKINGNNFSDWLASVGVALPIGRNGNHLNLTYSFNRQGTLDNNLILESNHQLSLSFSLRDVWFLKRKFN